ncbi:MAG: VOC family protein [Planctomycetota bacterium]|nr:VOC family protein [Planctomycetota bacterium]
MGIESSSSSPPLPRRRGRVVAAGAWAALALLTLGACASDAPPTPRVEAVGGVTIGAEDAAALAGWWREAFGLPFEEDGPGRWMVVMLSRDVWGLGIRRSPYILIEESDVNRSGDDARLTLRLRVVNLEAMRAGLVEIGATVGDVVETTSGPVVRVTDPEGNVVELWEDTRPVTRDWRGQSHMRGTWGGSSRW